MTQSHTHIYILFLILSSIMLHHKWLVIVPSAIQQDLITYPFQMQSFASVNHSFQLIPLLPPPPWQPQFCSPSPGVSFLWKALFVPYISFQICVNPILCIDISLLQEPFKKIFLKTNKRSLLLIMFEFFDWFLLKQLNTLRSSPRGAVVNEFD